MAYYNNRNNNRYNGGHKKNNYYKNNNYKRYDDRPQRETADVFTGFDATQYRKPDIEIKDLNGKIYTVSGNFSTAFSAELLKCKKQIDEINKEHDDIKKFPEIFDLLREWCLSLINLNIEGKKYTMDDVNAGFNDIYVLYNLIAYISKVISANKPQQLFNNK